MKDVTSSGGRQAGRRIPEAWILNLRERTLEVYREPSEGLYRSRVALVDEDKVSPLARPDAVIPVSELMP